MLKEEEIIIRKNYDHPEGPKIELIGTRDAFIIRHGGYLGKEDVYLAVIPEVVTTKTGPTYVETPQERMRNVLVAGVRDGVPPICGLSEGAQQTLLDDICAVLDPDTHYTFRVDTGVRARRLWRDAIHGTDVGYLDRGKEKVLFASPNTSEVSVIVTTHRIAWSFPDEDGDREWCSVRVSYGVYNAETPAASLIKNIERSVNYLPHRTKLVNTDLRQDISSAKLFEELPTWARPSLLSYDNDERALSDFNALQALVQHNEALAEAEAKAEANAQALDNVIDNALSDDVPKPTEDGVWIGNTDEMYYGRVRLPVDPFHMIFTSKGVYCYDAGGVIISHVALLKDSSGDKGTYTREEVLYAIFNGGRDKRLVEILYPFPCAQSCAGAAFQATDFPKETYAFVKKLLFKTFSDTDLIRVENDGTAKRAYESLDMLLPCTDGFKHIPMPVMADGEESSFLKTYIALRKKYPDHTISVCENEFRVVGTVDVVPFTLD